MDPQGLVGKQIRQFMLEKLIAKGSTGLVFKARDMVLDRVVALKLISKDDALPYSIEARRRFILEAQAAGRLSHPGIVTVYSYGETDDFQFICMELVRGHTLAEVLAEEKRLSVKRALNLFQQVLLALEASHKAGIVHRDIKPSNLMVDRDGRLKVMDFGIAKISSLSITTAGTILGTPYYMSPEQITGSMVDIRSDLFSIGAVIYQALTGEKPFDAETHTALAYLIVNVEPVHPTITNPDIPEIICDIIHKAMMKDPAERYQTPGEMRGSLARAAGELFPGSDNSMFDTTHTSWASDFQARHEEKEHAEEEPRTDNESWTKELQEEGRAIGRGGKSGLAERREDAATGEIARAHPSDAINSALEKLRSLLASMQARPTNELRSRRRLYVLLIALAAALCLYFFSGGFPNMPSWRQAVVFEGRYHVIGMNPNGAPYQGTATLSRIGERFYLTWNLSNQVFSGTGRLSGNMLTVDWTAAGAAGTIRYTVSPRGVLKGSWGVKGSETLVPMR